MLIKIHIREFPKTSITLPKDCHGNTQSRIEFVLEPNASIYNIDTTQVSIVFSRLRGKSLATLFYLYNKFAKPFLWVSPPTLFAWKATKRAWGKYNQKLQSETTTESKIWIFSFSPVALCKFCNTYQVEELVIISRFIHANLYKVFI